MKTNPDKFHLLLTTKKDDCATITAEKVENGKGENLVGVTTYNRLNFNEYVNKLCDKDSTKLNALANISS